MKQDDEPHVKPYHRSYQRSQECRHFAQYVFVLSVAFLLPATAWADVGAAFCLIVTTIQGNLGKALATIAVMMLGLMAMFGRVTWPQALVVATGIAVVFGAASLVNTVVPGAGGCSGAS